jgi:hypothetical protein
VWNFALETTTERVKGCNNIGTIPFNLLAILETKELKTFNYVLTLCCTCCSRTFPKWDKITNINLIEKMGLSYCHYSY